MPSDPPYSSGRLRFGEFEVDLRSHELQREGRRIRLQEKSFLVLATLLARPGEVVTREELAAVLWPRDYFVDAEHGLNTAVRRLREALGESAEAPRYVETLPRLGYRFLAAVEEAPGAAKRARDLAEEGAAPTARPSTREGTHPDTASAVATSPPIVVAAPVPAPLVSGRVLAVGALVSTLAVALVAVFVVRSRPRAPTGNDSTRLTAPRSAAVDELLARARYLRNHKRFEEARQFVERALQIDPTNAEAVAGLALALLANRQFEQARATAVRAIELDPKAWEAHRVLGNLALWAGDFNGAERHYRRSVEANPTDSKSRNRLARHLLDCGRLDEAREQMAVSRRLAPDDPDVQNIWIQYALLTGDYEGAIRRGEIWMAVWGEQLQSASVAGIQYMIALAKVGARRVEEAVTLFREIDPADDLSVALALGYVGRTAEARAILDAHEVSDAAPGTPAKPALAEDMALAYIAIGDFDRAFRHLDRLLAARWHPSYLNVPLFRSIRTDARWPAFAARLEREFYRGKSETVLPVRPEPFAGRLRPTRPPPSESSVRTESPGPG